MDIKQMTPQKSFVSAMRNFFGTKPNQTLKEFGDELKALTPKDRDDLVVMFAGEGINIDPTSVHPAKKESDQKSAS